jgi:hypothetical protein
VSQTVVLLVMAAVLSAIAVGVATLTYVTIELPGIRLGQAVAGRTRFSTRARRRGVEAIGAIVIRSRAHRVASARVGLGSTGAASPRTSGISARIVEASNSAVKRLPHFDMWPVCLSPSSLGSGVQSAQNDLRIGIETLSKFRETADRDEAVLARAFESFLGMLTPSVVENQRGLQAGILRERDQADVLPGDPIRQALPEQAGDLVAILMLASGLVFAAVFPSRAVAEPFGQPCRKIDVTEDEPSPAEIGLG